MKKIVKDEEELIDLLWIMKYKPVRLMKVERINDKKLEVEFENLNRKGKLRRKIKKLERSIKDYLNIIDHYLIFFKRDKNDLKNYKKKLAKLKDERKK